MNSETLTTADIPEKCFTTKQVFERLLKLTADEKMRDYLQQKIQIIAERDVQALQ